MTKNHSCICLIKPSLGEQRGRPYRTPAVLAPLVFALIAGATPPSVSLRLIDERLEDIPFDEPFTAVAVTVETFTARRSYQIAAAFRRRGVKVILGGFHPTLLQAEAAEYADALALGEVETVWPKVVADLQAGELKPVYTPDPDSAALFRLDRRILAGHRYLPLTLMETSRGCVFNCHFCSVRRFYGPQVRYRDIAEVVAEVRSLGRRFLFFVDDNITANPQRALRLFQALKPLGIRWISQASLSTARNPQFLDAMAESGCFSVIIGLESLVPENLHHMNKQWTLGLGNLGPLLEEYRKRGILVYGTFVFGYDFDTPESIRNTIDFALDRKLFLANLNILQPFPGTKVYDDLSAEGRLLYERWWLDPRYRWGQPAFRPRHLSVETLAEAVAVGRRRFTSLGSIFRRLCDLQANAADPFRAAVFLATNLVSRLDIRSKNGLRLGFSENAPEGGTP